MTSSWKNSALHALIAGHRGCHWNPHLDIEHAVVVVDAEVADERRASGFNAV